MTKLDELTQKAYAALIQVAEAFDYADPHEQTKAAVLAVLAGVLEMVPEAMTVDEDSYTDGYNDFRTSWLRRLDQTMEGK